MDCMSFIENMYSLHEVRGIYPFIAYGEYCFWLQYSWGRECFHKQNGIKSKGLYNVLGLRDV